MTNKSELNKKWAELEGFKEVTIRDGITQWEGEYSNYPELPDFTEPNRFFAEVVPRMRNLNFDWEKIDSGRSSWQYFVWILRTCGQDERKEFVGKFAYEQEMFEAGLEAAINAREKLNV